MAPRVDSTTDDIFFVFVQFVPEVPVAKLVASSSLCFGMYD